MVLYTSTSLIAERCASADRCAKYILDNSKLEVKQPIGRSDAHEIFAGSLDEKPVAIKKLCTYIAESDSKCDVKDLVNEIRIMSRSANLLRFFEDFS
jgi:hypothetical protein